MFLTQSVPGRCAIVLWSLPSGFSKTSSETRLAAHGARHRANKIHRPSGDQDGSPDRCARCDR
jgi:hypothetical protein